MIKVPVVFAFALLLLACAGVKKAIVPAATTLLPYETLPDAEEKKVLRGLLLPAQIAADTSFGWYAKNARYVKPDPNAVATLAAKSGNFQLMLFVGTWCHDTQQLLPKYFKTFEAAGMAPENLTLIGVDRNKTTIFNLHRLFYVVNVPTLIVMQNGKEVGRIVEYGKSGMVDKELAEMISALPVAAK
jgi:thiol-disulfide isomerase/thioredoxin